MPSKVRVTARWKVPLESAAKIMLSRTAAKIAKQAVKIDYDHKLFHHPYVSYQLRLLLKTKQSIDYSSSSLMQIVILILKIIKNRCQLKRFKANRWQIKQ